MRDRPAVGPPLQRKSGPISRGGPTPFLANRGYVAQPAAKVIQKAPPVGGPPAASSLVMTNSGLFADPISGNNVLRAGSVRLTTPAAQAFNVYNAPDGTAVLGYPFLMLTGQINGAGGAYNGVRFHMLNGLTQGPSSSANLVPMPANFNVGQPWLGFENQYKADYQNFPTHYEASVNTWKTTALVGVAPGTPLGQNIVNFPHTISAQYWNWNGVAWVVGAPPLANVVVGTNPQAGAGNSVDLSQHTAHTIRNILGLSPLLSRAIAGAHLALASPVTGIVTTPKEAYEVICDAIRSSVMGALAADGAISALDRNWGRLQRLLKRPNNIFPNARINALNNNPVVGTNFRPATD